MKKEGYTIILAGGGAKGSYQIGAWRALEEEKIHIQAAAGASVGSLNAAMIAQNDLKAAEEIWSSLNLEKVVDIPRKLIKDGKIHLSREVLTDPQIISSAWKKGILLDSTPLRKTIKTYLDEEKIRRRDFDLGIVTVNRTDMKPEEVFLSDMPEGLLEKYLLASSSLPVFKSTEIGGKKYLDGAFHDNIPFHMMKERGYRRFIVVDISGMGINRKPDVAGTETIYIKNSIDIGGILDFNPYLLEENRKLGYLDTMKIFGKNDGLKYFLIPRRKLEKQLEMLLERPDTGKLIREYGRGKTDTNLKSILPREYRNRKDVIHSLAECAALALKIPRIKLYSFESYIDLIHEKYLEAETSGPLVERPDFQEFFRLIRMRMKELKPGHMGQKFSSYELIKAGEKITGTRKSNMEKRALVRMFPELPGAFIFFRILKTFYGDPDSLED